MRAISRRVGERLRQRVKIREHELTADEPKRSGGEDSGPSPQELLAASLAHCKTIHRGGGERQGSRRDGTCGVLELTCREMLD